MDNFGLVEQFNIGADFHEPAYITLQGFRLMLLEGEEVTNLFV